VHGNDDHGDLSGPKQTASLGKFAISFFDDRDFEPANTGLSAAGTRVPVWPRFSVMLTIVKRLDARLSQTLPLTAKDSLINT
jgi:hypothetical protein